MEQTQQATPPSILPSHQTPLVVKIFLALLFTLFVAGISAGVTYYILHRNQQPLQTNLTPTIKPSFIPVPTTDPIANWNMYTDMKYNYSFKYPGLWTDRTESRERELGNFTIETPEGERIHGTIGSGSPDLENDKKNKGSSKSFAINKQKYLFVVYVTCDGPECMLGRKHLDIFDQILSTFKFVDNVPTPEPTTSAKRLSYFLPTDWIKVQDRTGTFEIGYNPQESVFNQGSISTDLNISLMKVGQYGGQSDSVSIKPYDGGSRHKFIFGTTVFQNQDKLPGYYEQNYTYNGWSCLVIYGVGISQWPTTQGMCAIDSTRAFAFSTWKVEVGTEQLIQTIKLLK